MLKIVLPLVAAAILGAGCTANGSPSPAPAPPATSGPGASAAPASPGASSALGGSTPTTTPASPRTTATTGPGTVTTDIDLRPWATGPTTITHSPKVPPVPVVTRVRYAAHPAEGYDRIVLDIDGPLPSLTARYVTEVRQDGSGNPVSVPGAYHLLVVLHPAQAHTESGAATVRGIHRTDLAMLESYAIVGDYEGYVSVALGLNGKKGYRIGELPGRVYLDVRR